jgi:hypothetical protein
VTGYAKMFHNTLGLPVVVCGRQSFMGRDKGREC